MASSVFSLCQISSNDLIKGINVDPKGWSIKYKVNIVPQTLMKPSGSVVPILHTVLQNCQFAKITKKKSIAQKPRKLCPGMLNFYNFDFGSFLILIA